MAKIPQAYRLTAFPAREYRLAKKAPGIPKKMAREPVAQARPASR